MQSTHSLKGLNQLANLNPSAGGRRGMPDEQLARALGKAANPILILDRAGSVMWCNEAYCTLVGRPVDAVVRKRPSSLQSIDGESGRFINTIWSIVFGGQIWKGELAEKRSDGTVVYVDAMLSPLADADGFPSLFMLVLHDITERKMEVDKVWRLANHDRLTDLANRAYFQSILEHTIGSSSRNKSMFALLYIDLDGFKAANDLHGHAVGDLVLIEAGKILTASVRRSDFVARIGGDEFVCLLADVPEKADAGVVADHVIKTLRAMPPVDGRTIPIGASIGISFFPDNGLTQESLLTSADKSMYEAKRAGKNCWRMAAADIAQTHEQETSRAPVHE